MMNPIVNKLIQLALSLPTAEYVLEPDAPIHLYNAIKENDACHIEALISKKPFCDFTHERTITTI